MDHSPENELEAAVEASDHQAAGTLLGSGIDPNARSELLETRLFDIALASGDRRMIDLFVRFGADIEHPDTSGRTLLSRAASSRDESETMMILLANDADPNLQDDSGWTALHWAVVHGYGANAEALIAHGADPKRVTADGLSVAELARRNDHVELAESFSPRGPDGLVTTELEQVTCEEARSILGQLPIGTVEDHGQLNQLLGALQYFIPQVLRQDHRVWREEALDGVHSIVASVRSMDTLEILGTATIMSSQADVPLYVHLKAPTQGDAFEELEIRLGEAGRSGMVPETYTTRDKVWKRIYLLDGNADGIDWAFTAIRTK